MSDQIDKLSNTKSIFCNYCRGFTHHILKATHTRNVLQEPTETGYTCRVEHLLWVCAGCETALLEYHVLCEDPNGKLQGVDASYYEPKRDRDNHSRKFFRKLPKRLSNLYGEVIEAFNSKLDILTAGGLRALVEGICADKGISGNNLEKKIDNMAQLLPQNIVTSLHGFRFIGNTALHELNPPSRDDLRIAIIVSEDLLNFLYELDYKASLLPKSTRPKP